jgi:hypothetical protein
VPGHRTRHSHHHCDTTDLMVAASTPRLASALMASSVRWVRASPGSSEAVRNVNRRVDSLTRVKWMVGSGDYGTLGLIGGLISALRTALDWAVTERGHTHRLWYLGGPKENGPLVARNNVAPG